MVGQARRQVFVEPARVRAPRDKAQVERNVRFLRVTAEHNEALRHDRRANLAQIDLTCQAYR